MTQIDAGVGSAKQIQVTSVLGIGSGVGFCDVFNNRENGPCPVHSKEVVVRKEDTSVGILLNK